MAGEGGPRHHRSHSGDAERAVDGEAEVAPATAFPEGVGALLQEPGKRFDALSRKGADRQDRRFRERGRGKEIAKRGGYHPHALGVHPVDLGQRHRAPFESHQLQDVQVLAGLGHHPVVGGDHQESEVDGGDAGDHVADELFMSRARPRIRAWFPHRIPGRQSRDRC